MKTHLRSASVTMQKDSVSKKRSSVDSGVSGVMTVRLLGSARQRSSKSERTSIWPRSTAVLGSQRTRREESTDLSNTLIAFDIASPPSTLPSAIACCISGTLR